MFDDASEFLIRTGQKPRHVFKRDQGDIERIAETNKSSAFEGGVDIQAAGQKRRLVRRRYRSGAHRDGQNRQPDYMRSVRALPGNNPHRRSCE